VTGQLVQNKHDKQGSLCNHSVLSWNFFATSSALLSRLVVAVVIAVVVAAVVAVVVAVVVVVVVVVAVVVVVVVQRRYHNVSCSQLEACS
jgi:Flp pilus assembly protein TadB